jgi:flagellar hook-length control protein FliK
MARQAGLSAEPFSSQLQTILDRQATNLEGNSQHLPALPANIESVPDVGLPPQQLLLSGLMHPTLDPPIASVNSQSLQRSPNLQQQPHGEELPLEVRELPILMRAVIVPVQPPSTGVATGVAEISQQTSAPQLRGENVQKTPQSAAVPEVGIRTNEVLSSSSIEQHEPSLAQSNQRETSRLGISQAEVNQLNSGQREASHSITNRLETIVSTNAGSGPTTAEIDTQSVRTQESMHFSQNYNARDTEQSEWVRNLAQREFNSQEAVAKNLQVAQDATRFTQNNQLEIMPPAVRPVIEIIRPQKIPQSIGHVEISAPAIENLTVLSHPQRVSTSTQVPQLALATSLESVDWSSTFADKVQQILRGNLKQAEIRLDPPHLGKIQVKIDLAGESTSITFFSDQVVVRDAIDSATTRLRGQLASTGFDNVEVDISSGSEQKNNQDESDANKRLSIGKYSLDDETDEMTGREKSELVEVDILSTDGSAGSISLYV